jgi:threonine dehydratase
MLGLEPPTLAEVRAARERLSGIALRTPLVRLNVEDAPAEIYLKLENLQPIGSFKLRGAGNAMAVAEAAALARGVCTASAGNMAQGVAWCARQRGVPCTVVMPDHAPQTKQAAVERLGARVIKVPFDAWWQALVDRRYPGVDGVFIHPVSDRAVMAGNGTIALEIIEDLADVDTVVIPYGGGGLSCGIAAALRELRPKAKVYACEVETAAPLHAALEAGVPTPIDYRPSFVDGIGGKGVLAEMWPLAQRLLDGSLVVSLDAVAGAIRMLAERDRVVAEGAGAAPVAAAMSGRAGGGKVVCVVSGGNIDPAKLAVILQGGMP